jgi:hypothetical protein
MGRFLNIGKRNVSHSGENTFWGYTWTLKSLSLFLLTPSLLTESYYVAQDSLDLWSSYLSLPSAGVIDVHHHTCWDLDSEVTKPKGISGSVLILPVTVQVARGRRAGALPTSFPSCICLMCPRRNGTCCSGIHRAWGIVGGDREQRQLRHTLRKDSSQHWWVNLQSSVQQ